jgi:hypothetical protein
VNKRIIVALAAVLGFVLLSAEGCAQKRIGIVNDVVGPPLSNTLGCNANKGGNWSISVDPDGHEGESIDERAKYRQHFCVTEPQAKKYKSGSVYP